MYDLSFDFETFSECDLKKEGVSRYARHPSTEVLMCSYIIADQQPKIWVPAEGEPLPDDLLQAWRDPDCVKRAWNAPFEWHMLKYVLDIEIPFDQIRDTMALAYTLALPGSLDKAGERVGLKDDKKKMSRGKALIRKFCVPQKITKNSQIERRTRFTDPEDWREFKSYCIRDSIAEKAILNKIRKWELSPREHQLWVLDQKINQRGIPVNLAAVSNAVQLVNELLADRISKMKLISGLDNPNSNTQLHGWLKDHGYPFEDMKAGHIRQALESAESEPLIDFDYVSVLRMRQEISKSSIKKFLALQTKADEDGALRFCLQYAGAGRTWRWSGRNFQPHNLARPAYRFKKIQQDIARDIEKLDLGTLEILHGTPAELLSSAIRPMIQAPDGYLLLDADLNAIENRAVGWLCNEKKILQVFEDDKCPYMDFATHMFHMSYGEIEREYKNGNEDKRTTAKPAVLGCGYRLGPGQEYENEKTGEMEATGLLGYSWGMGIRLTKQQCEEAVEVWRQTYTKVVDMWYALEEAAMNAVRTRRPHRCGLVVFYIDGPFLKMRLPSGRDLSYLRPKLQMTEMPWGGEKLSLTYESALDSGGWGRVATHGGKLLENASQAVSRDILANGIILAHDEGLDVTFHVHDQVICVSPEYRASEELELLVKCMEVTPDWAKGFPLKSKGHITKCFIKD